MLEAEEHDKELVQHSWGKVLWGKKSHNEGLGGKSNKCTGKATSATDILHTDKRKSQAVQEMSDMAVYRMPLYNCIVLK